MVTAAIDRTDRDRPWVTHYPPGIDWNTPIDLTPVHELVLRSCEKNPDGDALDFMGKKTKFGEL
jgi:long-chain acyl-CoA synthetase